MLNQHEPDAASRLTRFEAAWEAVQQDNSVASATRLEVDNLWRRIDEHLSYAGATDGVRPSPAAESATVTTSPSPPVPPELQPPRTWATVSIFVSSTFEEFHEERERLARRVFPALREWCEARRIALYDCDLHWGANQDQRSAKAEAARVSLELVDRCRAGTGGHLRGGAFFLGLVGDKLGPVPTESELTPALVSGFGWVVGCSITQMEMLRGSLIGGSTSRNALFMLRSGSGAGNGDAGAVRHRLEIVRRFPLDQVVEYTPDAPPFAGSGLDQFEENVLTFFERAIAEHLPGHAMVHAVAASDTELGESNEVHINYMLSLADAPCSSQDRCLRLLTNFVETGEFSMTDFKLFGDSADHIAFGLPGMKSVVISGDAGAGKSTVLARLGSRFLERRGFDVLAHFAQFSPASNDRRTLQRKMKSFLRGLLPEAEAARTAGEDGSVSDLFNSIMQVRRTMLILIDAFECFYEVSHVGELLPVAWPQNVRCIVSCRKKDLERCFSERSVCLYELEGLSSEAQSSMCRNHLGDFGKLLEPEQLAALLGKPGATNPLWLSQACAELLLRGEWNCAALTTRIAEMSGDARGLLRSVAGRILSEDGNGSAAALLALVCVARVGLWERHARFMVRFAVERRNANGVESAQNGRPEALEALPLADYLALLQKTQPFLRTIARESTALAFRHELCRTAVLDLLLDTPELSKRWHSTVADFILARGCGCLVGGCGEDTVTDGCLSRDLPYHLYWSDRRSELHAILQGAREERRQFGLRITNLTAGGVYSSWRCRVSKVAEKTPLACLVACDACANEQARVGHHPRAQCCIYCGLALNLARPGSAVGATTCRQHQAPDPSRQRCWFCDRACSDSGTPLHVCNFCNSSASSYLCYQPVLETDPHFVNVVRNQTKKFGLLW